MIAVQNALARKRPPFNSIYFSTKNEKQNCNTWLCRQRLGSLCKCANCRHWWDLGTTGLGAHVSVPLKPNLNARFGLNYLSYSYSGDTSDVDYDFKLKLSTFNALIDYFPMDGAFRVSAGLVYNGNKIDANAKPKAGTYTVNGTTYDAATAGSINGNIDFRKIAPYLGIGWGNPVKDAGWGFSTDLGVMFQGSPSTSLANRNCTAVAAICTQLASDVAAENRSLSDKADDFKAYPVLRVGASYRF